MGDNASGRQCLEEALRHDPQLFEALYCFATFSMQKERNPETALSYLSQIITSRLSSIHLAAVHGWKAAVYMKLGRYAEGIASAEDAINSAPEAEWAWGVGGRLYALARHHGQQWLDPAADFWQRFIQKHPHNVEAWAELGYVYWFLREQKNKTDKIDLSQRSQLAFTKAMDLGLEDDGLVWDRIGHLYQEEDNWKEAEKAYRKATQRNPDQFGYCLGVSLMSLNLYEGALPWVLAAAEKHQPDAMSWLQVAICQEKMGKIVEATAAYEKAIQLDPNYAEAWFNLGGLHWNQEDIQKAIATWKEAMDRFPDHKLCKQVREVVGF
jgi:tetratricopeptide (TPR) repeat protein